MKFRKQSKTSFELVFPDRLFEWEEFETIGQFRQHLMSELKTRESDMGPMRYSVVTHKSRYVYGRCTLRGCSAALRYKLEEGGRLKLTKAEVSHHHMLAQCRRFKFLAVKEYLDSFPSTVPNSTLRLTVCQQFNLTSKQFYYIFGKHRNKPAPVDQLIHQLEKEGYEVFASEEPRSAHQPPQILVLTNKTMQEHYRRYGDVIGFDLTYNLIKNVHSSGQKWKLGCFVALTSARKIVPVAVVATLYSTSQVYIQIFRTMFRSLQKPPAILVTDEEKAVLSAIEELKHSGQFSGLHLLDPYHILHNVRKRLSQKENVVLFSRILHARNRAEFEMLVQQARRRLPPQELPTLQRFIDRSHLYCFAAIQPRFFGFSASTSPNQCLHSVLKRMQPQEKDYSIAIRNGLVCCKELASKSHRADIELTPLQQVFHLPELRVIRMVVCKVVMGQLTEELALSMRLDVVDNDPQKMTIREYGSVFEVTLKRGDMQEPMSERWKCNCGYQRKSLLPCRHQLRTILSKKEAILPYLPDRWKLEEVIENSSAGSKGREKNSSRRFRP